MILHILNIKEGFKMSQAVNKSAPTLGVAIGYFAITLWAVPQGYISEANSVEAVAMAGIVTTNIIMELKALFGWIGSFFNKKE